MTSSKKTVRVSSIYKRFKGTFLNRSKITEEREIAHPGFTRLGMELNDTFLQEEILSVVYWGKQESMFLDKFTSQQQEQILKKIIEKNPPLFLLSKNFQHSQILLKVNEEFNEKRSAIIQIAFSTVEIYSLIGT